MKNKRKYICIELQQPCSVSIDDMTATTHGYYCEHCAKEVVDFRFMNDTEFAALMHKQKNIPDCGLFRPDQLERNITVPTPQSRNFIPAALLTAGIFLGSELNASDNPKQLSTKQSPLQEETNKSNNIVYRLHGSVIDSTNKKTILQATVTTIPDAVCHIDSTGNFRIELTVQKEIEQILLLVQAPGYKSAYYRMKASRRSTLRCLLVPVHNEGIEDRTSDKGNAVSDSVIRKVLSKFGKFRVETLIEDTSD